jgi:hypothetical protein
MRGLVAPVFRRGLKPRDVFNYEYAKVGVRAEVWTHLIKERVVTSQ